MPETKTIEQGVRAPGKEKMKLYEINIEIMRLVDAIPFDEETGEILGDVDGLFEEINALQMEKRKILEYLAKLVLNIRSDAAALKAEEDRLKARRKRLEKKEDRLIRVLDRECAGETTDLGVATLGYRKTSRVEVADPAKAVRWLKRHKFLTAFRIPSPEVAKTEVRKLIKAGNKVPGCVLVDDVSCRLS